MKSQARDVKLMDHNYQVEGLKDGVMKLEGDTLMGKVLASKVIYEFLYNQMNKTYEGMSYIKVSILVPKHIMGFIIGIEGKNINDIREKSDSKIEIFQEDIDEKFRRVEIAGKFFIKARLTIFLRQLSLFTVL